MTIRIFHLLLVSLVLLPSAIGTQRETVSSEFRSLVPRQTLPLLHAPEVHQELKLSAKQVTELESLFAEIDGPWFRLRNLSEQQQLPILDSLDQRVHSWLAEHVTNEQRERLRQIELQAQNVRMLLRSDVALELKLESMQQERFAKLARSTDAAQSALQKLSCLANRVTTCRRKQRQRQKPSRMRSKRCSKLSNCSVCRKCWVSPLRPAN